MTDIQPLELWAWHEAIGQIARRENEAAKHEIEGLLSRNLHSPPLRCKPLGPRGLDLNEPQFEQMLERGAFESAAICLLAHAPPMTFASLILNY
jgi:hypothetical protein